MNGIITSPCSLENSLVKNSQIGFHIAIRDELKNPFLCLWVEEKIQDVPTCWTDVHFHLMVGGGDPESTSVSVECLSESKLRLVGEMRGTTFGGLFVLDLVASKSKESIYDGIFTMSNANVINDIAKKVTILPNDSNPNIFIISFPFRDRSLNPGDLIYHEQKWWSMKCWYSTIQIELFRREEDTNRRIIKRPSVIHCQKIDLRGSQSAESVSSLLMNPPLSESASLSSDIEQLQISLRAFLQEADDSDGLASVKLSALFTLKHALESASKSIEESNRI